MFQDVEMNDILYSTCFEGHESPTIPHHLHSAYFAAIKHAKHGRETLTLVSLVL